MGDALLDRTLRNRTIAGYSKGRNELPGDRTLTLSLGGVYRTLSLHNPLVHENTSTTSGSLYIRVA